MTNVSVCLSYGRWDEMYIEVLWYLGSWIKKIVNLPIDKNKCLCYVFKLHLGPLRLFSYTKMYLCRCPNFTSIPLIFYVYLCSIAKRCFKFYFHRCVSVHVFNTSLHNKKSCELDFLSMTRHVQYNVLWSPSNPASITNGLLQAKVVLFKGYC